MERVHLQSPVLHTAEQSFNFRKIGITLVVSVATAALAKQIWEKGITPLNLFGAVVLLGGGLSLTLIWNKTHQPSSVQAQPTYDLQTLNLIDDEIHHLETHDSRFLIKSGSLKDYYSLDAESAHTEEEQLKGHKKLLFLDLAFAQLIREASYDELGEIMILAERLKKCGDSMKESCENISLHKEQFKEYLDVRFKQDLDKLIQKFASKNKHKD